MGRQKQPYSILKPNRHTPFYRVRWGDDKKRTAFTLGTTQKVLAYKLAEQRYQKRISGKGRIRLADYAKDFFVWGKCHYLSDRLDGGYSVPKQTAQQHRGHLVNHILREFGQAFLDEITPRKFIDWRKTIHRANQTKNHIRNAFKIVMEEAWKEGLIPENPIAKTDPVEKKIYKARDIFTEEEGQKLFFVDENLLLKIWKRPDYLTLFSLLAFSGMREGEVRGLCWEQIHWSSGAILVDRAVNCDEEMGPPKAKKIRVAILPEHLLERLKAWRLLSACTKGDEFVFPGAIPGKPFAKETLIAIFHSALAAANIDVKGRNLVPHSLRHTCSTSMQSALPATVVDLVLGSSAEMRARYNHPTFKEAFRGLDDHVQKIREALEWQNRKPMSTLKSTPE
jgi:integrase